MTDETKIKTDETGTNDKTEDTETSVKTVDNAGAMSEENRSAIEGVKERLRFFFSDANIRQDIFLRRLLVKEEDGRSVAINTMLRFNTIKKHTEDPVVLIQAAKELNDMLVVDEEKATLSRVVPFTLDMMNGNIPKSLYIKNLPLKDAPAAAATDDDKSSTPRKQYDVTVDEIRALFEKYGDVAMVKFKFSPFPSDGANNDGGNGKQRNFSKRKPLHPKGTAMIEFHKQEDLDKAAEATLTVKGGEKQEPKDKLVLEGKPEADLEVMLLSEHVELQKKENEKRNEKGSNKRIREDDDEEVQQENEFPKFLVDWKPGCVIKMRGLPAACDREAIMDMLAKGLEISLQELKDRKIYADYSRGQTDGAIRFPQPDDKIVEVAKSLSEGGLTIQDVKLDEAVVLEGEEEKKYWDEFIEFKTKQIQHKAEEKRAKQQSQKKKTFRRGGRGRH